LTRDEKRMFPAVMVVDNDRSVMDKAYLNAAHFLFNCR